MCSLERTKNGSCEDEDEAGVNFHQNDSVAQLDIKLLQGLYTMHRSRFVSECILEAASLLTGNL